jgi:hypothetical protein
MARKVAMPPKGPPKGPPPPKDGKVAAKGAGPLAGKIAKGKSKCACDDKVPKGKVTR